MFLAKRKNGIFFIEYFDPNENKLRRMSTGTKEKKEALKFLSNFELPTITHSYNPPKKATILLSQFHKEYIEFIGSTHSKKYLSSIDLSFKQLINFYGNIPLTSLTVRHVQQFISETYKRTKFGAALCNRTLKAGFNIGIEWEYIEVNPFKKVRLPKMEKPVPIFITETELKTIIDNTLQRTLKDLFFLAFHTGMRLGEIINLKWDAVNLEDRIIYVRNTSEFKTKSKKERVIPINQKLFDVLEKIRENNDPNDYVFHKCQGVKLNSDYVSQLFRTAVRKTNINRKVHFHTLRHSFASNLVQRGASIYVIKELLGHSDITTTQIYSHLQKENLVSAVSLLDD